MQVTTVPFASSGHVLSCVLYSNEREPRAESSRWSMKVLHRRPPIASTGWR
jgi:hypothetical protein